MKKKNLLSIFLIWIVIFTLNPHWIVSQNITSTNLEPAFFEEERPIKYRVLNDFKKLTKYAEGLEKKDSIQEIQLHLKDSIILALTEINDRYENKVIPSFENQIKLFQQQISLESELYALEEEKWQLKLDKLKAKRLGLSAFAGAGLSGAGFIPSVGVGVSYTFIRF